MAHKDSTENWVLLHRNDTQQLNFQPNKSGNIVRFINRNLELANFPAYANDA